MWKKIVMAFGIVGSLQACSHSIHLVHVSDNNPDYSLTEGRPVQVSTEQKVIMGFAFDVNYVDDAYALIQQECPSGSVHAMTSQYSTSHGFFHWTNKILIKGRCVQ